MTRNELTSDPVDGRGVNTSDDGGDASDSILFEFTALVLAAHGNNLTLRSVGSGERVTLRASESELWKILPGHVVRVMATKKWSWRKHVYVSGLVLEHGTDPVAAGIEPLKLQNLGKMDLKRVHDPFTRDDPNYAFWKKSTASARMVYEFEGIAWGILNSNDPDAEENMLTTYAADEANPRDARKLLMQALAIDVRCIDAHAHLGNFDWERRPDRAIGHYLVAVAIAELSLPANFDGILPWGCINNRPYLRALHGLGLCQWRLGQADAARKTFERLLELNPADNQGARFCWDAVCRGIPWERFDA